MCTQVLPASQRRAVWMAAYSVWTRIAGMHHLVMTPLALTALKFRNELNSKTYEDLQNDPKLRNHRNAFDNQPIRTVVVKNWQKGDVLSLIFHRLTVIAKPFRSRHKNFTRAHSSVSPQNIPQLLVVSTKRSAFPKLTSACEMSSSSCGMLRFKTALTLTLGT